MNQLNAIGNIGRDAEIRFTPSNQQVAQFRFALTSGYGDKQVTSWINCSLWGKRAETLAPMLLKGTRVGITGELTNRAYTDKAGLEKHSLELNVSDITLLGSKSDANNQASKNNSPQAAKQHDAGSFDDLDDGPLPF